VSYSEGGASFAGGYRLDTPFGYMLAPNITPMRLRESATGSADDSSSLDARRRDHAGRVPVTPVMPYDFYTKVTREDSDAIYAYLRTLKPVRMPVDVNTCASRSTSAFRWRSGGSVPSPRARTGRRGRNHRHESGQAPTWSRASAIAARVIRPTTSWAESRRTRNSPARASTAGSP